MKILFSLLIIFLTHTLTGYAQMWNPYGQIHTGSNIITGKKTRPKPEGLTTASFMRAAGVQAGNLFYLNDHWFIEAAAGYKVSRVVLKNQIFTNSMNRRQYVQLKYVTSYNNFYMPVRLGTTINGGILPGNFLISAGVTGGYISYLDSDIQFGSGSRGGSQDSPTGGYDADFRNIALSGYTYRYWALGINIRNNPFKRLPQLYLGLEANWQLQYSPSQLYPVAVYGPGGNVPVINAYHLSHRTMDVLLTITYLRQGAVKGNVYQYDRHNY